VEAGQTLDHQPRPGIPPKKSQRDRLIRLAQTHPEWALGYEDETWWSRLAQPALHAWSEPDEFLRLVEQTVASPDPDPKALACYGLLLRRGAEPEEVWLRFVQGRPVSAITTQFLDWCCVRLKERQVPVLLLVWDNASWHLSRAVRTWIGQHNRQVKQERNGVRILPCFLPTKSPWLNPIDPKWVHGKRAIIEPARLLTAQEVAERVCSYFDCEHEAHLIIPDQAA
jgi:transposase